MRYFKGKNGLEYQNELDAQKYGDGCVGYREVVETVVPVTYTELTGQPAPESPVDHVIETISTPTGPVPVVDLSPVQPVVQVVVEKEILSTPVEVAEIKEAVKEEIVMQEIPKGVEIVDWNSKTDADLKAMCKEKRVRGYAFMKRENMIKKLS